MRTGALFNLAATTGILAVAHAGGLKNSGAVHPFAKYKSLVLGSDAASATTSSVPTPTPTPARPLLECFQVAEPVLTPSGVTRRDSSHLPALAPAEQVPIEAVSEDRGDASSSLSPCTVVLMKHTFVNSYGFPFVGQYTPPKCAFDHVVINFTTLVRGRQYDRTGVMYLGDTEVWRTSTAEPTPYGIRWEWLKDMTAFRALWTRPQTLVFDLENIVDGTYTGLLNTTLTATFFKAPSHAASHPDSEGTRSSAPADRIIPITQRLGAAGKPSQFVYPAQRASVAVSNFPRNANRAVFAVDVKGQGNEEFWWSNVPQSAARAFEATYGEYPGYSPFREVQVLVDGHLAGVSWPFPVIYTGGVVPQLHRPIVGIQAFDISEHEVDLSPFLPLLCDGKAHTFEIRIVGLVDDGGSRAVLSNTTDDEWYITGKVFVWLDDDARSVTTGTLDSRSLASAARPPSISLSQRLTQDAAGANETLNYNLAVSRTLSISSFVKTQKTRGTVKWTQSLSYSNVGGVTGYGNNNLNIFSIAGSDAATGPRTSYAARYAYPLFANSTAVVLPEGNLTLWARVDQGLQVEVRGDAVLPSGIEGFVAAGKVGSGSGSNKGAVTNTWRNATANYYRPGDNSYSTGSGQTRQVFSFGSVNAAGRVAELYYRDVSAANDTVTADRVEVGGRVVRG
ncbi:peptide N-acetyl-beta-D-glucosaminyl asparaginase amidase A-domain-containing protein [Nemania sp. NC0429]|nr:peptide N-acetyl-beta-D-glucosaminyl asparaginase amidase A-domain-containing protein [Nemania sp. NC0429]